MRKLVVGGAALVFLFVAGCGGNEEPVRSVDLTPSDWGYRCFLDQVAEGFDSDSALRECRAAATSNYGVGSPELQEFNEGALSARRCASDRGAQMCIPENHGG